MLLTRLTRPAVWLLLLGFTLAPARLWAFDPSLPVATEPTPGSFALAHDRTTATLLVDPADWPGVIRAAHDLHDDIHRVTGLDAPFNDDARPPRGPTAENIILIGTIGRSRLIDRLIRAHKIDVSSIQGQWESTLTKVVNHPLPGVARALVIAGSDKRGSIFGIYDLSQAIGVSPWYWWADVPVAHKDALYLSAGRWVQGPPAVKYRGIFLNDEAPALTGWVNEKFGGYNHLFYT
ncbi:MAG: glycosyl hydrolase 115 family protein, partial [Acidobacteriaceae bacterium]